MAIDGVCVDDITFFIDEDLHPDCAGNMGLASKGRVSWVW